jgi:UDP-glucose 4-epimerase
MSLKPHHAPTLTVLLTGARGRLGSLLINALSRPNLNVEAFSRTPHEHIHALQDLFTPGLWEHADTLVHTAWSSVPLISERDVGMEWRQDLPLLSQILKTLANRSKPAHFIFFSSGGTVYGNATERPSHEDDILRPKGWHGFAKTQAEAFIQWFCPRHGIDYTILRISNPYGFPSAATRPQGIIPILIKTAIDGGIFRLWGDGQAQKDYLHISDFSEALRLVITGRVTGIYNLCYGTSYSVLEIIQRVETLLGRPLSIDYCTAYEWDVTQSHINNRRLCSAIAWTPATTLDAGLILCANQLGPRSKP